MSNTDRQGPVASRVAAMAFVVGGSLGALEALWVVATRAGMRLDSAALVILYGYLGYGGAAAVLALACAGLITRAPRRGAAVGEVSPVTWGVGIAVATTVSAHLIAAWARTAHRSEPWLLPGCLLSGAMLGWLATRLLTWRSAVQQPSPWLAANLGLLVLALLVAEARADTSWLVFGGCLGLVIMALVIAAEVARRGAAQDGLSAGVGLILVALACVSALVAPADRMVSVPPRAAGGAPNVLLISVDTLRADRLGCYGATDVRTPHIDALAAQGVVFEQAASAIALTGPSHTTMLTGLYHHRHGAEGNGIPIKAGVPTVADILAQRGYRTAAFVSGWTLKNAASGLGWRFEYYDQDFSPSAVLPDDIFDLVLPRMLAELSRRVGLRIERVDRPGSRTTARVLDWLHRHRDERAFVFAHYFDPHAPYEPPKPYDTMYDPEYPPDGPAAVFSYFIPPSKWQRIISTPRDVEHFTALYDGEVSYADDEVGRLLAGVEALGLARDTLVLFTSDHGESLVEHDFFFDHGEFLYDTCVHVPLIIRFPDGRRAGTRQAAQVSLADLTPTILEAVGAAVPPGLDGRSLLPVLDDPTANRGAPAFGWIPPSHQEGAFRARYSVRADGYKLIWNFDRRQRRREPVYEELYDLTSDPLERHNLVRGNVPILDTLRATLQTWRDTKSAEPQGTTGPSTEVQERLRALGY